MISLETHHNEAVVIYHPEHSFSKQAIGYAQATFEHVREYNLDKQQLSGRMIEDLAYKLSVSVADLLDRDLAKEKLGEDSEPGSDIDFIKIFQHQPILMRSPIILTYKEAIIVHSPGDFDKISTPTNDY